MPFTGFWERWRRRHLQLRADAAKQPSLRETEEQRAAAEHHAAEELAAVVTKAGSHAPIARTRTAEAAKCGCCGSR